MRNFTVKFSGDVDKIRDEALNGGLEFAYQIKKGNRV